LFTVNSWWAQRWKRVEGSVALLIEESAKFLAAVLVLALCFGVLRAFAALGYNAERIELLETIDYYAMAAIIIMFLLDLVLKVAGSLFSG
jgi:hypothetical protein